MNGWRKMNGVYRPVYTPQLLSRRKAGFGGRRYAGGRAGASHVDASGAGVGGGGGVEPDFEELWNYDDSPDMQSNPNGWFGDDDWGVGGVGVSQGKSVMTLDTIGPASESGSGISKSLRLGYVSKNYSWWWEDNEYSETPAYDRDTTYPSDGFVGTTIGKTIDLPGGGAAFGNEVWIEVWYRVSDNWKTDWPVPGSGASDGWKMLFIWADGASGAGRPEVKLVESKHWQNGNSSGPGGLHRTCVDGPNNCANTFPIGSCTRYPEGWNDVWHYYRLHLKHDTGGGGFFRFHDSKGLRLGPASLGATDWVDGWGGGEPYEPLEDLSVTSVGNGFHQLEVSRTFNEGPWLGTPTLPAGSVAKTVGYVPIKYPSGADIFDIPADTDIAMYAWFGPIRVWAEGNDPGWGW